MLVRNGNFQRSSFIINENPSGNEIYRIQHTIEMLKNSENTVQLKLQRLASESNHMMEQDSRQHILEILWGWQDLRRLVDSLPDSFIDKHVWLNEITEGLKKGGQLYKIFLQRYPVPSLA